MPAVPAIVMGGAAIGGALLSSRAQNRASKAATNNANMANQMQWDILQQNRADMENQRKLYDNIGYYKLKDELRENSMDSDKMGQYLSELSRIRQPNIPGLQNQVQSPTINAPHLQTMGSLVNSVDNPVLQSRAQLNLENDPIYNAQKEEIMRTLNRRAASQGKLNSSDADNAITRNLAGLMTDSYNRQLGDIERSNQNALAMYGVDTDTYNRMLADLQLGNQNALAGYGFNVDEYNRNLGNLERTNQNALLGYNMGTDQYARTQSNIMDRYNMQSMIEGMDYNKLMDAAKMASGAAQAAGNWGANAGSNIASTYNNMANRNMQQGQNKAENINSAIGGVLGAYNNYNLSQALKPQSVANTGYGTTQWLAPAEYNTTWSAR